MKIGRTSDVIGRLRQLQIGNPDPLWIVGQIDRNFSNESQYEAKLRYNFEIYRGEWFRETPELIEFITETNTFNVNNWFVSNIELIASNRLVSQILNVQEFQKIHSRWGSIFIPKDVKDLVGFAVNYKEIVLNYPWLVDI